MADKKISLLTELTSPSESDILPIVNSSETKKITLANIRNSIKPFIVVGTSGAVDYVCDGTADNVQIQVALTAVNASGGGIVHLKPGTYIIAAKLSIPSNVTLEGEGWTTILKSANSVNIGIIEGTSVDNVVIRDLAIDMNRANNTTLTGKQGIFFNTASNSMVDHVYLHDQRFKVATNYNSAVAFTNCTNCIFQNSFIYKVGDYGFVSNGAQQCRIINNYIVDASNHGIGIAHGGYGTSYERTSKNIVSGNIVYFDSDSTSSVEGIVGSKFDYTEISNNVIYHSVVGATAIHLRSSLEAESQAASSNYFVGNNFHGNIIYGFKSGVGAYGLIDGKISDNEIYLPNSDGGYGIGLYKGPTNDVDVPSVRNIVSNNHIREGVGVNTACQGIYFLNGANYNTISGNTIYNTSNSSIVGGDNATSDYCDYNQITGNEIIDSNAYSIWLAGKHCIINNNLIRGSSRLTTNTYDDIVLRNGADYNTIMGNNIVADGTNKSRYAINENSGSDYNVIMGNTFVGQLTGSIATISTNHEISHNITL